eukprot:TRINITY_DN25919_c0_g1_i1.p1 TRINITY_DN25919_c0_g1~~TRINITY_DN25919_c0_g1_i1.p1  ORF type:complete len:957 (+),score=178.37 TRINITY_DN25919_c0_g1_i1:103-2973(+)
MPGMQNGIAIGVPKAPITPPVQKMFAGRGGPPATGPNSKAPMVPQPKLLDVANKFVPDEGDDHDEWYSTQELSVEHVQLIKAKTMFDMVENITVGTHPCKMLFLSNIQADLLARNSDCLENMLQELNIPKPKLVINFLQSTYHESWQPDAERFEPGRMSRMPFVSEEEERAVLQRLDTFMADVLIPLAASTNAVVVTCALTETCILTESFSKMFALARSKWGLHVPFSILSLSGAVGRLYANPDENAHWRDLRQASKTWTARDKKLSMEALKMQTKFGAQTVSFDIDPNATCLILCDRLVPKKSGFDSEPFIRFRTELMRHLSMSVPTLTMKTGYSAKDYKGGSSLLPALSTVEAGGPVIFLDLRQRLPLQMDDVEGAAVTGKRSSIARQCKEEDPSYEEEVAKRRAVITCAKHALNRHCEELLLQGLMESFDVCSIAYLHQALSGGLDPEPSEHLRSSTAVPLHRAIKKARTRLETGLDGHAVFEKDVQDIAKYFAQRYFEDCVRYIEGKARDGEAATGDGLEAEAKNGLPVVGRLVTASSLQAKLPDATARYPPADESWPPGFRQKQANFATWIQQLLLSRNLYSLSVCDLREARRTLHQVVRLDRLPKTTSLEGLLLVQQSWREHDVAVHLARRYKMLAKFLYGAQLACGCIVVFASSQAAAVKPISTTLTGYYDHAAFAMTLALVALTSVDGYFNAKARWRHLRSAASGMESTIWLYRTRVGIFDVHSDPTKSDKPERRLCRQLNIWTDDLVASADLDRTAVMKEYSPKVYRHCQYNGDVPKKQVFDLDGSELDFVYDDMYSPVRPGKYIQLRILPMIKFYRERIPWYARQRTACQLLLVALTFCASVLVNYKYMGHAVAVSVLATTVTAWMEFRDVPCKLQRYTKVVKSLTEHLNWWRGLSSAEKASAESITTLVQGAESILEGERAGWFASGARQAGAGVSEESPKLETE